MLPESKNIQTIADNIRALENQINALDVEIPPHAAADSGKILAVDSEGDLEWKTEYSYTPPAYSSTEEVNTGQKWIDGKDIYCQVKTGNLPEITGSTNIILDDEYDVESIISCDVSVISSTIIGYNRYVSYYTKATKKVTIQAVQTAYSEGTYITKMFYTKPDPAPEAETKSKKGGTKK